MSILIIVLFNFSRIFKWNKNMCKPMIIFPAAFYIHTRNDELWCQNGSTWKFTKKEIFLLIANSIIFIKVRGAASSYCWNISRNSDLNVILIVSGFNTKRKNVKFYTHAIWCQCITLVRKRVFEIVDLLNWTTAGKLNIIHAIQSVAYESYEHMG